MSLLPHRHHLRITGWSFLTTRTASCVTSRYSPVFRSSLALRLSSMVFTISSVRKLLTAFRHLRDFHPEVSLEVVRIAGIVRFAEFRKLPFVHMGNAFDSDPADIQPNLFG